MKIFQPGLLGSGCYRDFEYLNGKQGEIFPCNREQISVEFMGIARTAVEKLSLLNRAWSFHIVRAHVMILS